MGVADAEGARVQAVQRYVTLLRTALVGRNSTVRRKPHGDPLVMERFAEQPDGDICRQEQSNCSVTQTVDPHTEASHRENRPD